MHIYTTYLTESWTAENKNKKNFDVYKVIKHFLLKYKI
jgi:hypothetical protein